jgi:hypothetical protein
VLVVRSQNASRMGQNRRVLITHWPIVAFRSAKGTFHSQSERHLSVQGGPIANQVRTGNHCADQARINAPVCKWSEPQFSWNCGTETRSVGQSTGLFEVDRTTAHSRTDRTSAPSRVATSNSSRADQFCKRTLSITSVGLPEAGTDSIE